MKVWLVSLFEPTVVDDTRPMRYMSIAHGLLKRNHKVTYFSSTFRHSTKAYRFNSTETVETNERFKTVFIHSLSYRRNISLERQKSHTKTSVDMLSYMQDMEHKPDIVLLAYPPVEMSIRIGNWAREQGIPFIVDFIDPWPLSHVKMLPAFLKPFGKLIFKKQFGQVKSVLKKSSGIASISDEYVSWAKQVSGLETLKNGIFYPAVDLDKVESKISSYRRKKIHVENQNEKLKIIYAGNLGNAYDIPCILKAAEIVENAYPGKTKFIIAGAGSYEGDIRKKAAKTGNISFLGRVDYDTLMENYAESNLGLAQYFAKGTQSITYKFFDYLGAGLPILNSLQGEMATLTIQHNVGLNNMPSNAKQLADNIIYILNNQEELNKMKANAINLTKKEGDNKVVYSRFAEYLESFAKTYDRDSLNHA